MLSDSKSFTSFSTTDIAAAKEFYTSKLGLTVQDEFDGGINFKTGGDTGFMVYIRSEHIPAVYTVLNFRVDDIEKVVDELNAKGVMMEMYPEMGTNEKGISTQQEARMAWFKDNAGNILSLMQLN